MKIALAGTGAMGVIHMKALQKIDGVEVVSIASRTKNRGKAFADEWKIPFHSTRPRGLHRSSRRGRRDPDHAERSARRPDRAGALEGQARPGRNPDGAEPARFRAHAGGARTKAGKICMVTHTRRFSPTHREIKRRIQEGTFHLHHMVVETYFFRRTNLNMHGQPRSWVDNLLWHHGCHSVDIAQWLLDDPNWDVWGQKGPDHPELGIPMDLTVAMKSKKGPLFSMAMSFNNKGPFGGFYRYIGEEDTYKVYRDSMTDSEGKEVPLDPHARLRSPGRRVRRRHPRGARTRNRAPPSCVPTMALLDRIEKAMRR